MSRARELSRIGSLTGISTITGIIHADQANSKFRVGTAVTMNSSDGDITTVGIITASSFVGDGSGITNAGSTLAAGSGAQRVVLTSQTSGAMTQTATNGNLTYNSTSDLLTVTGDCRVDSFGVGTAPSGTSGEIRATNDVTAFYSSDERLKENIVAIPDALAKLEAISGNTFDWREGFGEFHSHEGADCGVIAQEIEALGIPGLVTTRESGYKAVKYEKLTAILIEAVKELSGKVKHLEERCNCGQTHN